MIIPSDDDKNVVDVHATEFPGKMNDLAENLSPTLPLHFDKKYLPQNICEREYLQLYKCLDIRAPGGTESVTCSYNILTFQLCRKRRDIQILDGIKTWEVQHIDSLDKDNKKLYMQGLTFKLDRLKGEFQRMPSIASKQLKIAQLESDILQLKWRMKYIKKLI